jgi:replication factor A1
MTPKEKRQPERRDLDLLLISLQPAKPFTRRDGTGGEMISGIAGDTTGTARILCWDASMFAGYTPGTAIAVTGALEKEGDFGGREIVIDENSVVTLAERRPDIPCIPLAGVLPDQTVTVSGKLVRVQPSRPFTRRDGSVSQVRNVRISDGSATLPVVIWDDEAARPLLEGETVIIYHVPSRVGRTGETELSVGRGSCLLVIPGERGEQITMDGTVIRTPEGMIIDDGVKAYLIEGEYSHGADITITGVACGNRLFCEKNEQTRLNPEETGKKLTSFLQTLE